MYLRNRYSIIDIPFITDLCPYLLYSSPSSTCDSSCHPVARGSPLIHPPCHLWFTPTTPVTHGSPLLYPVTRGSPLQEMEAPTVENWVFLSDNSFSTDALVAMEDLVLQVITPYHSHSRPYLVIPSPMLQ